MTLSDSLQAVLRPEPVLTFTSAADWWQSHLARTSSLASPIDRAIVGATRVDRLGFAFAGGYAAALQAMVPSLPADTLASFAATEDGGAHPRAIATTLSRGEGGGFVLRGAKKWVTLGPEGGVVLVVARLADAPSAEDRPRLRVVRVSSRAPGVTITPLDATPFVPEIPHASIRFDDVAIANDAVLPGDGYDAYLKPFRTVEDIHVMAAFVAWATALSVRVGSPRDGTASAAALLASLRALAVEPPSSPAVHVALGGILGLVRATAAALDQTITAAGPDVQACWQRDRVILEVASSARTKRLEKAWASFT